MTTGWPLAIKPVFLAIFAKIYCFIGYDSERAPALGFIFITLLIDVSGLGIIIPVVPTLIRQLTGEGLSQAAVYSGWLTLPMPGRSFALRR